MSAYLMGILKAWRRFRRIKVGVAGLIIIVLFALLAIFAPLIAPYDPTKTYISKAFSPPSSKHLLGTDEAGRDVLSMLIFGSRVSLIVGVSAAVVGTLIGLVIGLISGYYGGALDNVLMRITDIFLIIPIFPLAIILAFVVGPSLLNLIILFGFLGWPGAARQIRSIVLSLKESQFIEAARALGAGNMRIIFNHLLPNVSGIVVASMIGRTTMAILGEAGLAFVGVVDPRNISWGRIISRALGSGAIIFGAWWTLLTPGLLLALLTLGFSLFGHGLTIYINPQITRR